MLVAESLTYAYRQALGLNQEQNLKWLAPEHLPYLHEHRARFESGSGE